MSGTSSTIPATSSVAPPTISETGSVGEGGLAYAPVSSAPVRARS